MGETYSISEASLDTLVLTLHQAGERVMGPKRVGDRIELSTLVGKGELAQQAFQSVTSAKGVVFPKVERLVRYRQEGKTVVLDDVDSEMPPTVLLGVRPCEARAFKALDAVFNWDTTDKFFNARMAKTTVISLACTEADTSCFCTSVGSSPDDPKGSDILLLPLKSGGFIAEVQTAKGQAIVAKAPGLFQPKLPNPIRMPVAQVATTFTASELETKLKGKFDNPIWLEQSLRCLGCGACAFVCPTCVCFDIQDEGNAANGQRLRSWDSCGMRLFTLHASGHNPRDKQSQRWRQRVFHKFVYYPDRWKMLGCVGCGKCSRACPVDMNLKEHLAEAARL
jgi:ferredoxin